MKKILSLFVCLSTLLICFACGKATDVHPGNASTQTPNNSLSANIETPAPTAVSPSKTKAPDTRNIIMQNDSSNQERNRLLKEDLLFFANELPKLHKDPFTKLTKEAFEQETVALASQVDKLNNVQVFTRLAQIVASIGDAHTLIRFADGYRYPLQFYVFGEDIYIVNAEKGMENLLYQKVTAVNSMPIQEVVSLLSTIISHENESWLKNVLADYLARPVYLYGLGIVPDQKSVVFTVEGNGTQEDVTVPARAMPSFCKNTAGDILLGAFYDNYSYEYLSDTNALYFAYNVCEDPSSFQTFNKRMFEDVSSKKIEKIILDLRGNLGGNSMVIYPFLETLKQYKAEHASVQVFLLTGRATFSSGIFAIYDTIAAVPDAISIGEPTGGAPNCFGDVKSFLLPNSQVSIQYSTKYFSFTEAFSYKNKGTDTFIPDVLLSPTIEDYQSGNDAALNYALQYTK